MTRASPTITVAIPAYNAADWIGETLESVLAQTVLPDEIVVVDDGSKDETAAVVERYGDRVRLIRQDNGGASAAYNRCFREATSEYVAMCPADDLWEPHKIEWQRASITADPTIDVAFGHARYFGLEDRDFGRPVTVGSQPHEQFVAAMFEGNLVAAPSALVKRSLYLQLGPFREDLACEDYEFWMRALTARARFFYDPRLMVRLRQHGANISSQALSMWTMNFQIHSQYKDLGQPKVAEIILARDLRAMARCNVGLGQLEAAKAQYRQSFRRHPSVATMLALAALSIPGSGIAVRSLNRQRGNPTAA